MYAVTSLVHCLLRGATVLAARQPAPWAVSGSMWTRAHWDNIHNNSQSAQSAGPPRDCNISTLHVIPSPEHVIVAWLQPATLLKMIFKIGCPTKPPATKPPLQC